MTTFRFTFPRAPKISHILRFKDWVDRDHWRRYLVGWCLSFVVIVALGVSYFLLWPKSYTSTWTLILPGSGSAANVNVSSIGQASSAASSPFGQSTLSPKNIYKSIMEGDSLIASAAESMSLEAKEFGLPRLKLIDLTALILCEIKGKTSELAQQKAWAVHKALEKQLDSLRKDEIDKRADSVQSSLMDYKKSLEQARRRVVDYQKLSGLISLGQFSDLTASVEQMRRKISDQRADVARLEEQLEALKNQLHIDADDAVRALELAADPSFVRAARELADARTLFMDRSARFGPSHPQVLRERARQNQIQDELSLRLARVGVKEMTRALDLVSLIDAPMRADLIQSMVRGQSELTGKRRQLEESMQQLLAAQNHVERYRVAAAELDELQKSQMVAEAVYASAVARMDTSRADVYASYPLVQLLEEPTLPERPSQPRLLFSAIGIVGGTILSTAAWVMAWLYQLFVLKRSKKS